MNKEIGNFNGVSVMVNPETYEDIKKQKTIYENKILKESQQRINKAIEYIENKLEGTRKSLEYYMKQYNAFEVAKYTRDCKLYANILEILEGDNNE